jgi:hypothetical protein
MYNPFITEADVELVDSEEGCGQVYIFTTISATGRKASIL